MSSLCVLMLFSIIVVSFVSMETLPNDQDQYPLGCSQLQGLAPGRALSSLVELSLRANGFADVLELRAALPVAQLRHLESHELNKTGH